MNIFSYNNNQNSTLSIKRFLYALSILSSVVIVVFNFAIIKHIAVSSISLIVLFACVILIRVINKDFVWVLPIPALICFLFILGFYVIGGLMWGEDRETFSYIVGIRTIIAGYAFAVFLLPKYKIESILIIFYTLIGTMFLLSAFTFYTFWSRISAFSIVAQETEFINIHFMYIESIPFGILHHTFSFFGVFSIVLGLYLILEKKYLYKIKIEHGIVLVLIFWQFFFLHFIGSRTGLVILYGYLVYTLIQQLLKNRIKLYAFLLVVMLLISSAFAAYRSSPVTRIKIDMALHELKNYKLNDRLLSWKVGWEIIEQHFWMGVSNGKEAEFYDNYFKKNYPTNQTIRPHNQFIYYATVFGVPLTLFFILCMYLPIFMYWDKLFAVAKVFFIIHTFYCLIDTPFDIKEYFYFYSFWAPFLIYHSFSEYRSKLNAIIPKSVSPTL